MKFAVIKTGGKQYKVAAKDVIKIEKIEGKEGDTVEFDQVLMLAEDEGKDVEVGTPVLQGKKVTAKILEQAKDKKVTVVKYKPKTRYKRKKGHRQLYTKVEIQAV